MRWKSHVRFCDKEGMILPTRRSWPNLSLSPFLSIKRKRYIFWTSEIVVSPRGLEHSPPFASPPPLAWAKPSAEGFFFAKQKSGAKKSGAKKSGAVRMATFYYMDENRKAAKKIAFHFSFNFLRKDLVMWKTTFFVKKIIFLKQKAKLWKNFHCKKSMFFKKKKIKNSFLWQLVHQNAKLKKSKLQLIVTL